MSEQTEDTPYQLIVKFPDESASFVHGYEAGSLTPLYRKRIKPEWRKGKTVNDNNRF